MTMRKMAWKMLRKIQNSVILQEQDSCPAVEDKVIYNPYKKIYVKRMPSKRKTTKQELQILLKENEDDQDHVWVGDKMPETNENGTIRLWLQNWNGAEKWNEHKIMYQLSTLVDNNIHYFSIIESRINQYHKETCDKWRRSKERIMPNGEILISSVPGVPPTTPGQPGGLLSGYNGPLKTKYSTCKRDKMGRWHYHEFFGKERNLRIYTLYRVNPGAGSKEGDTTYWTQQKNYMNFENDGRNPRTAVIDDFCIEIQEAIDKKMSIIIMADFNETINGPEKNNQKFREMGLLNLMEEYIGDDGLPRTCSKGPNCIDHVWMTSNALDNVHRAGFAPFNFIKDSDHRGLYVDLFYKNILENNEHNLEPTKRRNLKSTIPNRVEKYIEVVQDQWDYHNIDNRFYEIRDAMKEENIEENIVKLNNLDKQITEILLYGERKCSNVPAHSIGAWSVKLKNAIRELIYCMTQRTKAKKVKVGDSIEEAVKLFQEADADWKAAKETYKDVCSNAKELRKNHIRECAEKNVERDETKTIESEVKRLQTIEDQREVAQRMKSVMKPFSRVGSTTILIPSMTEYSIQERNREGFNHYDIEQIWKKIIPQNGKDIKNWERVTNKKIVQELMILWQRKHFTQAQESPCGSTEWNDILRNKEVQEKILKGNYEVSNGMPIELQELFDQMKRPECIKEEITYQSTYQEFVEFIKGSSEMRSTSPSGRGYNHYRSLLIGEAEEQLKIIHAILELAREKNIILERWKKTVTTLMEKDTGSPKIHRMRSLHIIEAEVQFIAKLFYCKKLLHNAEKYDLITGQQYGGRKNKQAQTVVLNKMMYYNITHQQLLEAAFMDDDARNCYDRILTTMSAVEMRSWGQSYNEAEFTVEFLQQQQYYVKTGLGITSDYYTYSRADPTHGSGQGIGWAGVKFTRTSDTIFNIMKEKCAGMEFQDPDDTIKVKRNGDVFVDDTALGVTINCKKEHNTNALEQLKEDQQKHALLLYASGHKLAFDKCSFYWIRFIREGLKQRHCMNHEEPGELYVKEGYGHEEKRIKRLQPYECHRTLGHFVSVNGNQSRQKREIAKKVQNWCDKLRTRYLNGPDTIYAYRTYLVMSLKYMLSSSMLSYEECDELGKKVEGILFNAVNIQRNCARVVLYSPLSFGGLGIEHLYHIQCLEKIRFFFRHIRTNDVTGRLFQICMAWTQLEVGTKNHFFQEDYKEHHRRITPTWITHLWEYATKCKSKFIITKNSNKKLARKNDFYIMDAIKETPLTDQQKTRFNQIRLSLKIETAADIIYRHSGTEICENIYEGINFRRSNKGWPNILDLPKKWIQEWRTILKNYIEPKLQSRPLGRWINTTHQIWDAHVSEDGSTLQYKDKYFKLRMRDRVFSTQTQPQVECILPVDIYRRHGGYKIASLIQVTIPQVVNEVNIQLAWETRNMGTISFATQVKEKIVEEMKKNNIVAASDGSVLYGLAAHSYCIAMKDTNTIIASAVAPVDGKKSTMTSFRPEAMGALAIIQYLELISEEYEIDGVEIPIYIDNAETIQVMRGKKDVFRFSDEINDHADVSIELYQRMKKSRVNYTPEKVKGHMDDVSSTFTKAQELNIEVDKLVGEFIHNPTPRLYPTEVAPILQQQEILLVQNSVPIVTDVKETLIVSAMENKMISYNAKHHGMDLSKVAFDNKTLKTVLSSNKKKIGKRIKNIQNQWDTRDRCMQWKKSKTNICSLCHSEPETWQHIYHCKCEHMRRKVDKNDKFIEKKLKQLKTEPTLQKHILYVIRNWNNSDLEVSEDDINSPYYGKIVKAHEHQMQLGFGAFIKGFVSEKWSDVQQTYYAKEVRNFKYNIERWRQLLVKLIIDRGNELWEERCQILHAANIDTNEQRYRDFLFDFMVQTRDKNQLNSRDYHILKRKRKFFQYSSRTTLEMWHLRVMGMISYEDNRRKNEAVSISPFLVRRKRKRRQRLPQYTEVQQKRFHQQTLWNHGIEKRSNQTIQSTERDTQARIETQQRKRRLETLVNKRKKRRQLTLDHRVACNKNERKRVKMIKRTQPQTPNECKRRRLSKKNKKYTVIHARTSNRERIRRTGKDLKNDR